MALLTVAPFILLGWFFSAWLSENTALAKPYQESVSAPIEAQYQSVRIISLVR
ncbi:MAG: hypothetical protein HOO19_04510 [Rhodospirillaceae bacterium]|nr:hypothetical protein [Rhodospirillaceae bacterium]MBT3884277.1 hypothetical protein [Rhodospirillaceae bacterium]MBT4119102.1 hypothetical protein [Rhodospirillaceae bacterium]MBT4673702.1 hypothetical protein [Rhodospirillaceae bacterium]MBT4718493.1 hypothetical protein [Rhodospirillaceae bacterium]